MSDRGRDHEARGGARRQRGGTSGATPQRRSERVAERVLSQSPPRGRGRMSPPSPPSPPRQSEEVVALRASPFPLTPRVTLLAAAAVLAVVAQAVCLLPVAWPRGSPVLELCGGAAGARTHAAVAFAHFNVWLLQRELPHRPVRAACLMLTHLGLGSLAGGCAFSRCFLFPFASPSHASILAACMCFGRCARPAATGCASGWVAPARRSLCKAAVARAHR